MRDGSDRYEFDYYYRVGFLDSLSVEWQKIKIKDKIQESLHLYDFHLQKAPGLLW